MAHGRLLKNFTKPPIDTETKHYWGWKVKDGFIVERYEGSGYQYYLFPDIEFTDEERKRYGMRGGIL